MSLSASTQKNNIRRRAAAKKHTQAGKQVNRDAKGFPGRISLLPVEEVVAASNPLFKAACSHPRHYLHVLGHILVMSEMIAVLTPAVAIGIQWVAALCPGTAKEAIIVLVGLAYECALAGGCDLPREHCILRT
jgi:hypothetical protein